ncbi:hypothetical protein K2Q00_00705 [Patescibacteria group bacterium]|nr:hypothetical protein [Patescibacteria group bacterium]
MRYQFSVVVAAAALALALPAGLANASNPSTLSATGQSGGIVSQDKIVGLSYIPIFIRPEGGGDKLQTFPAGAFALFGPGPIGGDSRIELILKVDADFYDPFEDIKRLQATISTENGVISPKMPDDGDGRALTKHIQMVDSYTDKIARHVVAGTHQRGADKSAFISKRDPKEVSA